MTQRDYVEASAKRGNRFAAAQLVEPAVPPEGVYLLAMLDEVHGRSGGLGMEGQLAPLTYGTVAHYAQLRDVDVRPHEVEALMLLDAVRLAPGEDKTPTKAG